jgi:hypothetical protein
MGNESPLTFLYEFVFADGARTAVSVELDATTQALRAPQPLRSVAWAAVDRVCGADCELPEATGAVCPVAANLADLIERFGQRRSFEEVDVRVTAPERVYCAKVRLQQGLSSLTGIIMVTSGCPVLDKLRPMVRFHLPFATLQETTYRATSMYLLGQFMRHRRGLLPDWDLTGLEETYRRVHQVNLAIARCIRQAAAEDASANALVRLDVFTDGVAFSIRDAMQELEHLFSSAYLEADSGSF